MIEEDRLSGLSCGV